MDPHHPDSRTRAQCNDFGSRARLLFSIRCLFLSFGSCALLAALVTNASAQAIAQHPIGVEQIIRPEGEDTEADRLFNQGNSLLRQKKTNEAHQAYMAAWQKRRTFEIAASLGLTELSLEKPRDAAEHLSLAMLNAPKEASPALLDQLKHALDDAKTKVGTVAISTTEAGDLLVDGERVDWLDGGKTTDVFLLPGSRRLTLHRDGYEDASQTVEIAKGAVQSASLSLIKLPASPHPVAAAAPSGPSGSGEVRSRPGEGCGSCVLEERGGASDWGRWIACAGVALLVGSRRLRRRAERRR